MASEKTQDERIQAASKRRREQQKQETRRAIVEAASALFQKRGYDGFSLRGVAEQIGYSPGTIYLYFDNKDALLFTIVDEGFRKFGEALDAAVAASDEPRQQLENMFDAYIEFGLANPVHYRLMFMERTDFLLRESESAPVGDTWSETFMTLQRTVQRCIDAGAIAGGDNAQARADAAWAGVHGVVALIISQPWIEQARLDAAIEAARGVLRRGLDPE